MNIYKVSCYSKCGSYFVSYLQSVSVMAMSKDEAKKFVQEWLRKEGRSFIADARHWEIELVSPAKPGVIDWHEDSDY